MASTIFDQLVANKDPSDYQVKDIDCPVCDNQNAKMITDQLDIPYYTDFMMMSINCIKCGFRSSDFFNLNSKGHTQYSYRVEAESDDTTKIVRAKGGKVSIPELGVIIDPVNEPQTWIRNIEGVLQDIESKVWIMINNPETKQMKELAEERLRLLESMKLYKTPFTIIIEDKRGNSIILPANEEKLEITYFDKKN
ncbi:MAG: ZPR1 zinc finger domain-containing protein [Candidatus Kariarchaeaceae archaeon]|jgi:ZPR1-related zinc finger protein